MSTQATMPAILDKITTLRDGSCKIQFETQEIDGLNAQELFALRGKLCWLVVAGTDKSEVIVPEAPPAEFKDQKTASQRLRSVLFVLWSKLNEQNKTQTKNFEDYYRIQMERFIEETKDEIEAIS